MTGSFYKTTVKGSFETLVTQLKIALDKEGFAVCGVADFQRAFSVEPTLQFKKYQILSVYIPHLFHEMVMLAPFEGMVVPCNISVIESYPGSIELIPVNPIEIIVRGIQSPSVQNLAEEVSRRMDIVLRALEHESTNTPDMVTSWG